jgi:MFS family permease
MTDATAPAPPISAAPLDTDALHPVSELYRRYALTLLVAVYTLNFLDRQIVNILGETIKKAMHLQDWQLGAMQGIAFAALYTVLGLPIARLAERGNRPWIIGGAIACWSAFTMLFGLAQNYAQLLATRVGVSVGEAGCSPPAHSLIADYTPRDKRASALAIYSLGTPIGSLLGMALGGLIADAWGWRAAFLIAGAPGMVFALVAGFTLIEPRKKLAAALHATQQARISLSETFKELAGKRTFWMMALGAAILAFQGYASQAFIGSFFFRNHVAELPAMAAQFGLKPQGFLGLALGLIGGTAGVLGTTLGGVLADRLGRRDLRWHVTMPAIATLVGLPFYWLGILAPNAWAAIFLLAIPTLTNTMWYGPIYGCTQGLVRPQSRATTAAIILFIINIIGLGGGPTFLGWLSGYLSEGQGLGDAVGLKVAMLVTGATLAGAAAFFLAARRTIREEMVS